LENGLRAGIECPERLVHQPDIRVGCERARERDTLSHPLRELSRVVVGIWTQTDQIEQFEGFLMRRLPATHLHRELHIPSRATPRQQVVAREHEHDLVRSHAIDGPTMHPDTPFLDPVEPGHEIQERRLAAAAGADQGDELAPVNREIDVLKDSTGSRRVGTEPVVQRIDLDGRRIRGFLAGKRSIAFMPLGCVHRPGDLRPDSMTRLDGLEVRRDAANLQPVPSETIIPLLNRA
jgi:hypothetical protein